MQVGLFNDIWLNPTHCSTYRRCGDFMTFIGVDGNESNKLGKVKLPKLEWYESWNDKVPLIQVGIRHGRVMENGMDEIRKFDLVEVCEPWFSTSAQIANEVPSVVFTYENIPLTHNTTAEANNIQACASKCRKWVVSTDMSYHCWVNVMNVPAEKVVKIPRATDCDQFRPADEPRTGKKRILLNGRLTWAKGGEDLIFAVKAMSRRRDDFEVSFIGVAEGMQKQYADLIKSLGIEKIVSVLPWRDYHEIPALYHDFDIACILSIPAHGWHEQWCMSPGEAMASGLPVIGTTSDGVSAQIVPEMLIPPNRHDLLAEKLEYLLNDDAARRQIGEANRQHMLDHFNAETRAKELREFYAACL